MRKYLVCFFIGFGLLMSCETTDTISKIEEHSYLEYVNPLMGTDSEFILSNGNTYPAIATPWGMNFWTPRRLRWVMVGAISMMIIKFGGLNKHTSLALGLMIMQPFL